MDRRSLVPQTGSDNPSAAADHLHRLRERRLLSVYQMIVTNRLDHAIHSDAVRKFQNLFNQIRFTEVDGMVGTQLAGGLEAEGLQVRYDGDPRADAVVEHIQYRQIKITC